MPFAVFVSACRYMSDGEVGGPNWISNHTARERSKPLARWELNGFGDPIGSAWVEHASLPIGRHVLSCLLCSPLMSCVLSGFCGLPKGLLTACGVGPVLGVGGRRFVPVIFLALCSANSPKKQCLLFMSGPNCKRFALPAQTWPQA